MELLFNFYFSSTFATSSNQLRGLLRKPIVDILLKDVIQMYSVHCNNSYDFLLFYNGAAGE